MPPRPSNAALDAAEAAFLTAMEDLDLVFGMPKVSSMSGFIPFKECLLSMDHHPAKEALFHLRELNNSSVCETKYRSPIAAMNEIHATLVWYERARDELGRSLWLRTRKARRCQIFRHHRRLWIGIRPKCVFDDDEDRADNEVLDLNWVVRKLMALQMEVDTVKNLQSTDAESRAGSGTVLAASISAKAMQLALRLAAPAATVSTGLKNKDDKAQAKEIRDKEVKAADAAERRAKGKVSIDLTGTTESTDSTAPKTFPADEKADKARRTKKLDPKNVASVATNGDTVVEPLTRKRRREQRAHVFDAEQDYQVPGAHPP
ncbi:hypothetical protein B0H12DRAFT_1072895 [Mycena haematopus]|nr:hypothetical protein B0H12DRAFT_1072895 [Mycena haematopus]